MNTRVIPSFKKKSKFADRGKAAEDAAKRFLEAWSSGHANREFTRLTDSKAAGRIIKAAAADFEFFFEHPVDFYPHHGLLEVKETQHAYRLDRPKVTQLPRLIKRANCGGTCLVLVHHSTSGTWRCVDAYWLRENGDKGSWNLSGFAEFGSPREALVDNNPVLWSA